LPRTPHRSIPRPVAASDQTLARSTSRAETTGTSGGSPAPYDAGPRPARPPSCGCSTRSICEPGNTAPGPVRGPSGAGAAGSRSPRRWTGVARRARPRSIPTSFMLAGSGVGATSTTNEASSLDHSRRTFPTFATRTPRAVTLYPLAGRAGTTAGCPYGNRNLGWPTFPALPLPGQRVEPVPESPARVLARPYQRDRGQSGPAIPVRVWWSSPGDDPTLHLGVADLLASPVGLVTRAQRVVEDDPGAPERPGQHLLLIRSRVLAIAIPGEHAPRGVGR